MTLHLINNQFIEQQEIRVKFNTTSAVAPVECSVTTEGEMRVRYCYIATCTI